MRYFSFYEDEHGKRPVADFLDQLPDRDRALILAKTEYLMRIPMFTTKLYKRFNEYPFDLGELRPLPYRIFVHRVSEEEYVMVHAFRKKSDATPRKELETARRRIEYFISQQNDGKPQP